MLLKFIRNIFSKKNNDKPYLEDEIIYNDNFKEEVIKRVRTKIKYHIDNDKKNKHNYLNSTF